MQPLHAFMFGSFVLILVYLAVQHGGPVAQILNAGGSNIVSIDKVLQGR